MSRIWNAIAGGLAFGAIVGLGLSLVLIRFEHHLDHAFYGRALDLAAETTLSIVAVAILAALAAVALRSGMENFLDSQRHGSWIALATFLTASLPVWFWIPLHARVLFSAGREEILTGWLAIALVHVLLFGVARRFASGAQGPVGLIKGVAVAAALTLILLFGSARARVFDVEGIEERPNVLLIVLDTVRADRLSSYGYSRPTTPELDAFAAEGVRFSNFYSTSSWTVPSHASMFTGMYPIQHGATQENLSLSNRFATLAEVLSNAGYQTFAASQNPFVSDSVNLAQGFSEFAALWRQWIHPDGTVRDARTERHLVNVAFEDYLDRTTGERPFFAFLNYIDAHLPTAPPEPHLSAFLREGVSVEEALEVGRRRWSRYYVGMPASKRDFEVLSDLYDAEMAFMSSVLEKLFDSLRRDGRFDNTLIVVTSDHGEQLGDHDHLGHMFALYNATVRVPLIVRMPGNESGGRVDDRLGQLVDLFPTILDVTGVSLADVGVQGVNLFASDDASKRTTVFSEYYFPAQALAMYDDEDPEVVERQMQPYRRRLRAVEAGGKRLIWSSTGDHELYDIANDPDETINRFEEWPDVANAMIERLDAAVAAYGGGESEIEMDDTTPEFDPETQDALRALGYIR